MITLSAVVFVFVNYRQVLNAPKNLMPIIQSKANIAIGEVHQTATRDGIKEWSLKASSAQYHNTDKLAVFQDLSVIFYLKDENRAYLTARQGTLKTDSNNIEVTGDVEARNDDYKLNTERLHYEHEHRLVTTNVPVQITGDFFDLSANTMLLDLNTNKALLEGNVVGIFDDTSRL
ncbi:MAG: LPS export ABC transporter periplasmic protein LptC [Deltaproteobacteria bacterium]|nr:LPS export ABC transporter periplasmic protein LptC [Deltaproteobacteria bacterium]